MASLVGLLAAGVVLAVGGCSATAGSSSAAMPHNLPASVMVPAPSGGSSAAAAPTQAASSGAASGGADSSAGQASSTGSGTSQLVDDRQIIRTASLALRLTVQPGKDAEATATALASAASDAGVTVRALATGSGGYVSAADGGGATVSVTLRVPSADYAAVMTNLADVGTVTSRTEKTDDVTDEMIDVSSRLATMKASVDRVRALLAKADKIGDVISIESELTQREADLESLENRQSAMNGQVAMSTITVVITAVPAGSVVAPPAETHGFLAGLAAGWESLKIFGTGVAAVVGAVLPFLPIVVVIALLVMWLRRRRPHPVVGSGPTISDGPPAG